MGLRRKIQRAAGRMAEEMPKRIFRAISRARHRGEKSSEVKLRVRDQLAVYRRLRTEDIAKAQSFLEAAEREILAKGD